MPNDSVQQKEAKEGLACGQFCQRTMEDVNGGMASYQRVDARDVGMQPVGWSEATLFCSPR